MPQMSVEAALLVGIELVHRGRHDEARALFAAVQDVQPQSVQAQIGEAWLEGKSGNRAAAVAAFEKILSTPSAWASVPRVLSDPTSPRWYDARLETLFGSAYPPVSDISDHLPTLFAETVAARPRLVVELGTRGGESTRSLIAAAQHVGARMLSIDINPCDLSNLPPDARALVTFIQSDDVAFGRDRFRPWAESQGLAPEIDVLFLDTSHVYDHTRDELAVWLPLLARNGVAMFHDTAMSEAYLRNDLSIGLGWNNDRGVIRAIEEYLGTTLDERQAFAGVIGGWLVRHDPRCSGFTILRQV